MVSFHAETIKAHCEIHRFATFKTYCKDIRQQIAGCFSYELEKQNDQNFYTVFEFKFYMQQ